jgi:hypothetical protein
MCREVVTGTVSGRGCRAGEGEKRRGQVWHAVSADETLCCVRHLLCGTVADASSAYMGAIWLLLQQRMQHSLEHPQKHTHTHTHARTHAHTRTRKWAHLQRQVRVMWLHPCTPVVWCFARMMRTGRPYTSVASCTTDLPVSASARTSSYVMCDALHVVAQHVRATA